MIGRFGSRTLRAAVAATLIGGYFSVATAGCFGNFALTRNVYRYNQQVDDDKWVQWLVFLVLNVVPVYGFATLFDAVFANSVEFWTGDNPVTARSEAERVVYGPRGEVTRATRLADGRIAFDVVEADGSRHALTLVREAGTVAAYAGDGRLIARVVEDGGAVTVLASGAD